VSTVIVVLASIAGVAGYLGQVLRWLRVAQREHYLPGTALQFQVRWTLSRPINLVAEACMAVLVLGVVLLHAHHQDLSSLAIMVVGLIGLVVPRGLSMKGRTSPLAMTTRMKRLAGVVGAISLVLFVSFSLFVSAFFGLGVVIVAAALIVDLGLRVLEPHERNNMQHFVDQAARTLGQVDPTIVAITGSYGKTSTKLHLTQILSGQRTVVATPASFNNRGGLARAINEHLSHGTEVFIAEMGTYGPGEIADLCAWIPPDISVMTAIGPVHLERFGSLEATLAAKAEITVAAKTIVLNVDDPRLRSLVDQLAAQGKTVVRCSTVNRAVEVAVEVAANGEAELFEHGNFVGSLGVLAAGVQPINVALAIGSGQALGVPTEQLLARASLLAAAANRSTVATTEGGVVVIDDTFNANPAGARAALLTLQRLDAPRRFVVTPGMIELGPEQRVANAEFAREAGAIADLVIVVGRTNKKALLQGLNGAPCAVQCFDTRDEAVAFIRTTVHARDAVLYENDLPDHYP